MSDEDMPKRRVRRLAGTTTMGDVARLANVSKPTVSRVLGGSNLVAAKTRDRVLAVARETGYAVNRNAQKLRQARTNTVAVVLDFGSHRHGAIGDPFIFELLAGVSEALSVRHVDLLLSPSGLNTAADFIDLYRSRGTDGFIVLGQGARDEMLRNLARKDVPMIVWGAVHHDAGYCAVGSDNFAGGRLAGERFISQRRQKWLFVGNIDHEEIRLRYDGLRAAATIMPNVTIDLLPTGSMTFAATYESAADYLDRGTRPDAVFAFSDTAAMAVISAFRERDHLTPRDYSLVGYNNIPPSAHSNPAITTIEQETGVAGAILVEKLMQRIDGGRPRSVMLPTKIIVRET